MGSDVNGPEPTGWELMRGLRDVRDIMQEEFRKMAERMDRNVSKEVFEAHEKAVAKQFEDHAQQLDELRDSHKAVEHADALRRRWLIGLIATGVVSPGFAAWITWLLTVK